MSKMTISQAIRRVKDLKGKIAKHQTHAAGSVSYAVKEPPAYAFMAELENAATLGKELLVLQTAIARANATTTINWQAQNDQPGSVESDVSLTWAVKRLEEIKGSIKWYEGLIVAAQPESVTESWEYQNADDDLKRVRIEKQMRCDLPEAKRNEVVQKLQDEFNKLNDVVETANHRTNVSFD
jgi:hypothetical protein